MERAGIIAYYTFKEILKSRIILNVSALGLALMVASYVASEFTYGVPQRVALDFGVGLFSLTAAALAIFMGAPLMAREIESRTIYMALSRSVGRFEFLVGKLLGMCAVLALNLLILGVMTYTVFFLLGGKFSSLMLWVIFFSFLEAFLILNIVVFFSLLTNMVLSIFYTVILFIAGHAIAGTLELTFVQNNPLLHTVIQIYSFIFPNLSLLNIKDHLIHQASLPSIYLFQASSYGIGYSLFLIFLSAWIFSRRELN